MNVWKPGAFAGKTVSREIAGALLSEVRHAKALSVPPHQHEVPYFSLLLDGSYEELAPDFAVRYEPYSLVFHDAYTEHQDAIAVGGCRMFFVEMLASWREALATIDKPAHLFEMTGSAPVWLALRLHREFLAAESALELTVESLIHELCSYVAQPTSDTEREPAWLARAEQILRDRSSRPIDLRGVAGEMGVNASHLCRTFRRFRRRTIGDYILGLRIQSVCRMLLHGVETLGDIAAESGFTDQSHMTRLFKRITGTTPAAYRRMLGAGAVYPITH